MKKCKWCEGKGYYNLSASYDDIHSRVPCDYCMGGGYEEDNEEEEYKNEKGERMKKYTFRSSKILYADMEAVIEADSYEKALEIAKDDTYNEENWEEIGIGESERIDSNNIRCENEKGE